MNEPQPHNDDATLEDLTYTSGKAELVDGRIVAMAPTGGAPGYAGDEIFVSLRAYARRVQRGIAVGDNKGFRVNLPQRQSFSPDAAYYTGPNPGMGFYAGAPAFAAEVRSEGNYGAEAELARKRADYFAAGTQVVWDVDLLSDEVVKVIEQVIPPTRRSIGAVRRLKPNRQCPVGPCRSMICFRPLSLAQSRTALRRFRTRSCA